MINSRFPLSRPWPSITIRLTQASLMLEADLGGPSHHAGCGRPPTSDLVALFLYRRLFILFQLGLCHLLLSLPPFFYLASSKTGPTLGLPFGPLGPPSGSEANCCMRESTRSRVLWNRPVFDFCLVRASHVGISTVATTTWRCTLKQETMVAGPRSASKEATCVE